MVDSFGRGGVILRSYKKNYKSFADIRNLPECPLISISEVKYLSKIYLIMKNILNCIFYIFISDELNGASY